MSADTLHTHHSITIVHHTWTGAGRQWAIDRPTVCIATVHHFEQLAAILACRSHSSVAEHAHAAAYQKLQPLLKVLHSVAVQTSNIPATQGYTVSLRRLEYALNVCGGPIRSFLATNSAGTHSPTNVTFMLRTANSSGHGVPSC